MRIAAGCKIILVLALLSVVPVQASDVDLAKAMAEAQGGNVNAPNATKDALTRKVITWKLLQQSNVTAPFESYTLFLAAAKGWPGMNTIQAHAESVMPDGIGDSDVIAWFDGRAPMTSRGTARYAAALERTGQHDAAVKAVREFFTTRDCGSESAAQLMTTFPGWLTADDVAVRTDKLIWEGKLDRAADLLAYLPVEARRIPSARIALLQNASNADEFLSALSRDEQNDPGLAYARAHWRRELGFDDSAATILARVNEPASREEDVAKERGILSRRFFERGDMGGAYAVAAAQPIVAGQNATQNIWYAGWLALRFRQDVNAAAQHFKDFYANVQTPVSKARGAYWLARTAETARQSSVAEQWYNEAAKYGTTFYGQLAAQKLNEEIQLPPRMADSMQSDILKDERLRAARILANAGDGPDGRAFFKTLLNDASDENEFAALANWSNQHNEPQWAVLAGKAAQQHGYAGLRAAYPILAKDIRSEFDARLDPALAHGLIRQESEFDIAACSHSGALGLMQLMPATAKGVARKIGTSYSQAALVSHPSCNVQLGSYYIADQLENFGNPYLAIAAYNAGPGNVRKWLTAFGDPRHDANVDMIDWIESIPAYETRNYVQRVTENQNVYAALFNRIASQKTDKIADR